jgi:hypothetical protein
MADEVLRLVISSMRIHEVVILVAALVALRGFSRLLG